VAIAGSPCAQLECRVGPEMLIKNDLTQKYINLLKKSLVGELHIENEYRILSVISYLLSGTRFTFEDVYAVNRLNPLFQNIQKTKMDGDTLVFNRRNLDGTVTPIHQLRNYTELAHTMIGMKRLDNIEYCIETVLEENVAGDMIETGVWRGGASIFMRGVLAAYGINDRAVWVADSFQGVPPPTHPQDANFDISANAYPFMVVSQEAVAELFERLWVA
jgi:O-methyltransferase